MRLRRKPSLWSDFFARLLFAVIWVGFFVIASWLAWHRRAGMSAFVLLLLAFFDLIAVGLLCDLAVRFWRTLQNHEPVVEIDHDLLAYGDSANVRVLEPDPESIDEIGVKLVGECWSKSMTDFTKYRRTVTAYSRCYEEELLRLSPSAGEPFSRLLKIQLPKSPPADGVRWKIVIDSRLKKGGVIEHLFPLRVRESNP